MFKNIYRYKIKYTNFLGGSNSDNEEEKIGEEEEKKSIDDIDQQNNNTNENQENSITNQQNTNNNTNQQNNNTNQQNSVVQTIKFKNKSEWPLNINEIQWSSRNIDLIENIVWENNGIGKDINDFTFYNTSTGYYILINGVGFRPEAFTNESRPIINNLLRSNNIEYNYDDDEFPEGL